MRTESNPSNDFKFGGDNDGVHDHYQELEHCYKKYGNKIYQLTISIDQRSPYYALMTLLNGGIWFEDDSLQNGDNTAQFGEQLKYGTHHGHCKCLNQSRTVHAADYGYQYPVLTLPEGALAVHDYRLNFDHSGETCSGTFSFAFYKTGTDLSAKNIIQQVSNAVVTCERLPAFVL
ncbi:unnamed protein product [Didymodactylos carnosus]|uniref:Uncharacterized protein n=1 Tax=Didymodactylos carnosus TaxID=1234261 RepID=A0A815CLZ6_9BILA|nr:unnamed protein product [Didymodactylos carnosus]CAF1289388.1 unnamed protein product [Didymodactylos carnosus]CAF3742486.1 unnamed protein product [Didymodactylos carnosus]CAF4093914.1 unnamed protein product [Didymodactylos carnosus]